MAFPLFLTRTFIALCSFVFGLALCVFLFRHAQVSAADWLALSQSLSLMGCVGVLALTALLMLSGAKKWAVLSQALHGDAGQEPAPGFFLRHYLWQNWIGQFVPPSLAIVLGRGWAARGMVQRSHNACHSGETFSSPTSGERKFNPESDLVDERNQKKSDSASSLQALPVASCGMTGLGVRAGLWNGLFDQALDFALLISFAPGCVAVLWFGGGWLAFLVGAVAGIGVAALGWQIGLRIMSRCAPHLVPQGVREALWPLFGWSFVRAALTILRLIVGIGALGLFLSELKVAAITPLVSVLALIPLTPGNLGIAEWGWQGMLVFAGEGAVTAALYAAAFRILIVVVQTVLLGAGEIAGHIKRSN